MAQPSPAPTDATNAARLATVSVRYDPTGIVVLGTFGTASKPGALLRLPNGNTLRITPGDHVGDAAVLAITDGKVMLESAGVTTALAPPGAHGPERFSGAPRTGYGR